MATALSKKSPAENLKAMHKLAPEMKRILGEMMGVRMSAPLFEHEKGAGRIKEPVDLAKEQNKYTSLVDFSRASFIADNMHEWAHEAQDKKGIHFDPVMDDLHAEVFMTRAMEELAEKVIPWNHDWKKTVLGSLDARLSPQQTSSYALGNAISVLYREGQISKQEIDSLIRIKSNEEFEQNLAKIRDTHAHKIIDLMADKFTNKYTNKDTARGMALAHFARAYPEYTHISLEKKPEFVEKLKRHLHYR